MGKPWARYEQNYINHPKFLALTSNAICLWLEGKNYCDMHQTDGLIPLEALRTFRFNGAKSMGLLLTSCGLKPNTQPYAPLWERSVIGFKMHDYLDHNDCRDEVLARIAAAEDAAEVRKAANRDRQQRFRDERKQKADASRNGNRNADSNAYVTRTSRTPTETETETPTLIPKEQESHTPARRQRDAIFGNEHRSHAVCGRACVPAFLHRELRTRLGGDEQASDDRLRAWYLAVENGLTEDEPLPADVLKFWRLRFDAEFVKPSVVVKSEAQQVEELRAEIARQNRAVSS